MDAVEWGTVAQWVSGLATAGALFLTYFLLRKESKSLELNREQMDRIERDRERAQARLVTVWRRSVMRNGDEWGITFEVQNDSDEPIADTEVRMIVHGREQAQSLGTLAPKAERKGKIRVPCPDDTDELPEVKEARCLFTDAEGRRWERHGSELRRVLE